jgi:hypothetical protein
MQLNDSYVMQRLEQQLLEQMSSYDTAEANRISEPSQAAAVAMSVPGLQDVAGTAILRNRGR